MDCPILQVDDDPEMGDVWTYCAIDAETKLVPTVKVGKCNRETTAAFAQDVASRMRNRAHRTARTSFGVTFFILG